MSEVFTFTKKVPLEDIDGRPIKEGSVLINVTDQDRGVVVEVGRVGHLSSTPMFSLGDISIQKYPGVRRVTNKYSDWKHLPHDEQTYKERYTSWLYRKYEHDEFAGWSEDTGMAVDGILALLPGDTVDWEGDGGPRNLEDALKLLAEHLAEIKVGQGTP